MSDSLRRAPSSSTPGKKSTFTRCSPARPPSDRIFNMVMLSVLLGPAATLSSARSLAFNCFVASTICFVIYYVTSANMNPMINGALLLRGGGGLGDEQGGLEIDQYRTQNSSVEVIAAIDDNDQVTDRDSDKNEHSSENAALNFTYNERSEVVRSYNCL